MAKNLGRKAIDYALEALANSSVGLPAKLGIKGAEALTGTDNPLAAYGQELKDVGSAARWVNQNMNPLYEEPSAAPPPPPAPKPSAPAAKPGEPPYEKVTNLDMEPGETIVARKPGSGGPAPTRMPEMDITPREPYAPGAPPPVAAEAVDENVPVVHKDNLDDEMAAAQAAARAQNSGVGTGILRFLSGFASNGEELNKAINERVNAPVAELLAKKKFLDERTAKARETEEYDRKKALDSSTGPLASQAQMLARLYHPEWTDEQVKGVTPNMIPALKDVSSFAQLEKHQTALEQQQAEAMKSQERIHGATLGETRRHNIAEEGIDREKLNAKGGEKNTSELFSVPGTEIAPGKYLGNIAIKGQEAADFRKATASSGAMQKASDRLKELIKAKGTEWLPSNAQKEMKELVSSMQIAVKDMASLGAISKTDMDIILGQIPDPTGLTPEWIANNTGTLLALDKDMRNKMQVKQDALGLVDGPGGRAPQGSADAVPVMPPGGKVPKLVPRSQVQAALAAGGTLVGG